jgi:hypothetical protein
MHRIAAGVIVAAALASGNHANAAEKFRFAYAVQVHQANMMVLGEYARKHGIELETVPMRRYADIQLALMTNQIDAAVLGYVNVEEPGGPQIGYGTEQPLGPAFQVNREHWRSGHGKNSAYQFHYVRPSDAGGTQVSRDRWIHLLGAQ